jgi:hypothetical protein
MVVTLCAGKHGARRGVTVQQESMPFESAEIFHGAGGPDSALRDAFWRLRGLMFGANFGGPGEMFYFQASVSRSRRIGACGTDAH